MPQESDRLESWKEIAAYLNRSVRTVRRWEAAEGLPVHRHMHRSLGSVYAFRSELDSWRADERRRSTPSSPLPPAGGEAASIAVLPFTNLTPDPSDEYFSDGLTDEVIADLSSIRSLRVISRTSSSVFKGTSRDVRTIGRELGVRYLVEGTVRRDGARLRISARLVDAASGDLVWSGRYDGTMDDVFGIQEKLARTIVDAFELELTGDDEQRLHERAGRNPHAYECYLQARQAAFRWRPDAIDHAVQLLRNGLAIVGEDGGLYAALGRTWLQYREAGIDWSEHPLEEAAKCAEQVVRLSPGSPDGSLLRGWIEYSRGDIQQAVRELRETLRIEPNNAEALALMSNCYLVSGRVSHARPLIDRLLAVDPLTPLNRCLPGWADVLEGEFAAAEAPYRRMFEMDPGNPMARLFYAWILALNGRADELRELAAAIPAEATESLPARITAGFARALAGEENATSRFAAEHEVAATATELFPRFLAQLHALAGEPGPAMRWLSIAVGRGFINYPFLSRHDPFFRTMRDEPRFREILAGARERWERFEP
jgi:TolB-like protein